MIYPDPKKTASPPATDHARVYIPPPLIYLFVFWIARMVDSMAYLGEVSRPARAFGWALAAVGAGIGIWSVSLFRKARTNLMPVRPTTALVTDGPYRLSRNPMYLGLLLAYIGVSLGTNTFWGFLSFPAVVLLVNGLVIRREERYLQAKFGPDYLAYKSQVRRWI